MQLPEALIQDLRPVPGFDEAAFLAAHNGAPVTSVRLHPHKPSTAFADAATVPWCPEGRYLEQRPVFTLDPLFHGGAYYVQEASSMFVDHLVRHLFPERNGLRVLDLCAAPGGKSTLLASLLGPDSLLVCNEVIRSRASILEENIARWGLANTWVVSNDPRDVGRVEDYFDLMVVDAPCSGSGLFRKDADALKEWSENNVALCSARQQRILADVWPALKEGGVLLYATCSYSPQEDEAILDWLAEDLEAETIAVSVPEEWGIVTVQSPRSKMTGYRFFPDKVKGEGFFIAAVRKPGEADEKKFFRFKSAHQAAVFEQAKPLLREGDWKCLKTSADGYSVLPAAHEADWHQLQKFVYLRRAGLPIGAPAAKEWLPSHELALSIDQGNGVRKVEVTKEQAIRFLRKEDLQLPDLPMGWLVLTYEGIGLGWVKSLKSRINNYLPKNLRIRMAFEE